MHFSSADLARCTDTHFMYAASRFRGTGNEVPITGSASMLQVAIKQGKDMR